MIDTRVIARFPFGRPLLVGALTGILAACQTAPSSPPSAESAGSGGEVAPLHGPEGDRFQRGLYAYLTAEMARREGAMGTASNWYARAAQVTGRTDLYGRSVEAALHARVGEKAVTYATEWRQVAPDRPEPLFALAQARLLAGQPEKAVAALDALVNAFPRADGLYLEAGERLAQSGGISSAVQVLRQTAKQNPDNAAAQLAYGHILARLEQRGEAATFLQRALEMRPDWEAAAVELARTYEVQKGVEVLRRFIADHPGAEQARLRYGQGLLAIGRPGEAEAVFKGLAAGSPEDPAVQMGLGLARFQQEEWQKAHSALRRVVELDPGNNEALFYLGRVAGALENFQTAANYFSRVSGGQYLEQARMQEAVAAVKLGDLQRALQLVRQMRSFHPEEPEYYRLEARVLFEMDQFKAAEQVATQGLQQDPGNTDLLYTRALIREQLGDYAGMEADIRQVIEQDPDEAQAYNFLGYSLADRGVRLRESLELLRKANELEPEQAYILDSLGWAYFRLGRLEKAESYLRRALARSAEDAEILSHLGEVLEAQGQAEKAREVWRRALNRAEQDSALARELRRRLHQEGQ
ncbi:tetratricopeptide repeat protein [Thiohalorhabdus sp. Cl-TMA]|uniref:Tetratricopeptide repeat protein n=1 Tax=Thiohalorhabdus methylotrophus TaxID=3242694 RepID=A0ABV4TPY8_9GAMM